MNRLLIFLLFIISTSFSAVTNVTLDYSTSTPLSITTTTDDLSESPVTYEGTFTITITTANALDDFSITIPQVTIERSGETTVTTTLQHQYENNALTANSETISITGNATSYTKTIKFKKIVTDIRDLKHGTYSLDNVTITVSDT
ncbi:hypothetical protein N9N03_00460 [Chlamydiia bacterium]|nr:hypothetical protein [Chlamydiia bacterium]